MSIEHHVTSLELSRKLKELGVPQTSYFYWWIDTYGIVKKQRLECGKPHNPKNGWTVCSAFLASELGEMLPNEIQAEPMGVNSGMLDCVKHDNGSWSYRYIDVCERHADTEPDARAALLIHLIEQKIIDPKNL